MRDNYNEGTACRLEIHFCAFKYVNGKYKLYRQIVVCHGHNKKETIMFNYVRFVLAGVMGLCTLLPVAYCKSIRPSVAAASSQAPASKLTEFEVPYGPVAGMNGPYGLMKQRHMYEYGTTQEQFAKMAVNQRFNALKNPNAVFKDQPITVDDVLNSRFINEPMHILESVMPCGGAAACCA